jgi:uncharacterized protein (DUF3820 family)
MIMDAYTDNTPIFFGKHKGTKLGNVPSEYLLWLYDTSEQGKRMFDQKLAVYIKDNLQAIKIQALAEKQRKRYEKY